MCAFCAQPLPESGKVCCAEYANSLDDPTFYGPSAAEPLEPAFAPAQTAPRARFVLGSQFLVGLLVSGVGALVLLLVHQGRVADERARELEATRRLSEEMIALMKETRVAATKPAIVPLPQAVAPEASAPETAAAAVPPAATAPGSAPGAEAPVEGAAAKPPPAPVVVPPAEASKPSPSTPGAIEATSAAAVPAAPRAEAPGDAKPAVRKEPSPPESEPGPASAPKPEKGVPKPEQAVKPKPIVEPKPALASVAPKRPAASPAETRAVAEQSPAEVALPSESERALAAKTSEPAPEVEERIRELASRAFPPIERPLPRAATVSTRWTELERGMSRGEVEALLGKPRWVESLMTGEFWLYADRSILGRGWVVFSDEGDVMGWSTP